VIKIVSGGKTLIYEDPKWKELKGGRGTLYNPVAALQKLERGEKVDGAIIRYREERGLPISLEKGEAIVSPEWAYTMLAVLVGLSFILLALLIWERR
jgi:hypothetical protein